MTTTDRRFAAFLRDFSAALKVDHYPLTPSTKVLDAYADELDPLVVATQPMPESPVVLATPHARMPVAEMSAAEVESATASEKHAPRRRNY